MISLLLYTLLSYTAAISCIDESGNYIDKWVIFKYPQGNEYAYWDTNTPLHATNTSLNATYSGALANTMNQLWTYYMSEYIMWNDEIPNSNENTYNVSVGHSKGLWMWDMTNTTGVFLQHSIPKWPMSPAESPESYAGLPPNAWTYGQHIVCLSVSYAELQAISESYQYIEPQIYATRGLFPLLGQLVNYTINTQVPTCTYSKYPTSELVGFAKNAKWNDDLYDNCIAPTLQESLYVESWRHGENPLGPFCRLPNVLNVESLNIDGRSFTTLEDHSKWTVSVSSTNYICFSDINRMLSQFQRGGGAICFENAQLAYDLQAAVQKSDTCG